MYIHIWNFYWNFMLQTFFFFLFWLLINNFHNITWDGVPDLVHNIYTTIFNIPQFSVNCSIIPGLPLFQPENIFDNIDNWPISQVCFLLCVNMYWASLVAQTVRNLLAVQETWVQSLGWDDPLEEGVATHSSFLPGESPWTEERWAIIHGDAKRWTRLSD